MVRSCFSLADEPGLSTLRQGDAGCDLPALRIKHRSMPDAGGGLISRISIGAGRAALIECVSMVGSGNLLW